MFGEYGIISTDIIPALIRIRPKGGWFFGMDIINFQKK